MHANPSFIIRPCLLSCHVFLFFKDEMCLCGCGYWVTPITAMYLPSIAKLVFESRVDPYSD